MFEQTDTFRIGYFEQLPLQKQAPYLCADKNLEWKRQGIGYLRPKDHNERIKPEYLCSPDRCYCMRAEKRDKGNEDTGGNSTGDLIRCQAFLHKIYPKGRLYEFTMYKDSEKGIEFIMMPISDHNRRIRLYSLRTCCTQYLADGSRLWIVVRGVQAAKEIKKNLPATLKGYFDGSFLNFTRFPTDASLYLFLCDPKSTHEKGIDMPIN